MKFSSAILLAITAMTASASPLVEKVLYLTLPYLPHLSHFPLLTLFSPTHT